MGRAFFIVNTVMPSERMLLYFRTNLLMFWQSIFDVNKIRGTAIFRDTFM